MDKKREVPIEIDDHFKLFGKQPWEVEYGEKCAVCDVRIDEYGFCSCGSGRIKLFFNFSHYNYNNYHKIIKTPPKLANEIIIRTIFCNSVKYP